MKWINRRIVLAISPVALVVGMLHVIPSSLLFYLENIWNLTITQSVVYINLVSISMNLLCPILPFTISYLIGRKARASYLLLCEKRVRASIVVLVSSSKSKCVFGFGGWSLSPPPKPKQTA
jgi:hypothetical protein